MLSRIKKPAILAVLVSMFALAGCGSTETPQKVGTTDTQQEDAEQVPQQQVFKIGDVIELGKFQFAVNGVREDKGSDSFKPPAGKRWIVVDATIVNKSNEPVAISSLTMFRVKDSDGRQYTEIIGPNINSRIGGELAPGDKMRGEIAFEVPETAKGLQLVFEPNLLGFGQAKVDLGK